MNKSPPEWQSRKFQVAGCFVGFVIAIGSLAALILIILLPGVKWVSNALRIFYVIVLASFGYFIVRPAMRKTSTESGEQYLYPLRTRAFAWSAALGLILVPVTGLSVVLVIMLFLMLSYIWNQ